MIGTTYGSTAGVATLSPSIAPRTVMAGVIMPSPYSNAAPNSPMSANFGQRGVPVACLRQQGGQREDAPFTVIVRAHHDGDVPHRDDEHERVDDERQDTEDVL
ncbi:MAG: hypothetical protein QM736_03730, partial [Vicinamibacterales bacterium]